MDTYKILLKASEIPIGSIVTKRTGSFNYMLKNQMRIFQEDGVCRLSTPSTNHLFLLRQTTGDVNEVSVDTIFCWVATRRELLAYLNKEE